MTSPSPRILPAAALAAALAPGACNEPAYYPGLDTLAVDGTADDDAHPVIGTYVQEDHDLDYRPPSAEDLAERRPPGGMPADMIPWIEAGSLEFSVTWTLENQDDMDRTAWVLLDGATEFYDWNPVALYGLAGGEEAEEVPLPSLLGYTPLHLGPREVRQGEFREDDLREAAYDLDVLTRFCGPPLAVLYNRHEVDPRGTENVPEDATIAGFYRLRLTLASDGHALLRYALRIRDRAGMLFDAARHQERFAAEPEPYVPPDLAAMAQTGSAPGTCGQAPP